MRSAAGARPSTACPSTPRAISTAWRSKTRVGCSKRSAVTIGTWVDASAERLELPTEVATVVYRVVQEALTNVVRHARASAASVSVTLHSGRLRAVIEDDGVGFNPAEPTACLGLRGMRERAEIAGGSLQLDSAPGSGVTVVLEVPVG